MDYRKLRSALILMLTVGVLVVNAIADYRPNADGQFQNRAELTEWSKQFFGYNPNIVEFSRDEIRVLVVLGMLTSGVETTHFRVYHDTDRGPRLVLVRESIHGNVEVTEKDDALIFKADGRTVLIQPWEGIEYWPETSKK